MRKEYYKYMFYIGAWWNWLISTVLFLGYREIFKFLGMGAPNYPIIFQLFFSFVFLFGIGYYWISKNLYNNLGIVKMGIIGKTLVFILLLFYGIKKDIHFVLVIPGIIDLIFAVLYLEALLWINKHNTTGT